MRLLFLFVLLLAGLLGTANAQPAPAPTPEDSSATLRVMSFNLRVNVPADGQNAWPYRKDMAASMIRFHQADLVGVQEALPGMLEDLEQRLPAFDWFGQGRDSTGGGEYSAVFYRPGRLELLDHDTFWLSETPSDPGSTGWDAALPRIVTWGRFRDRTSGDTFFLFNTHFDHVGEEARRESARLLLRQVEQIAGEAPVVVTGDFNADTASVPYEILTGDDALTDALHASETPHHGPRSTWSGFEAVAPGRRIDYVFVQGGSVRVLRHGILTDTWLGRFPSDHLPVLAVIAL